MTVFPNKLKGTANELLAKNIIYTLDDCPDIDSYHMMSLYNYAMQNKFKNYLIAVNPSADTTFKDQPLSYTEWNKRLNEILLKDNVPFLDAFAKAKYCLEKVFLDVTKCGKLEYTYTKDALLTSKELQEKLTISSSTISRYVEHGLEIVPGYGHRTYPKHNVFYWSNGVWASRIQSLYQTFRLRNRTKEDIIEEVKGEIAKLEGKYEGKFETVFGQIIDPYTLDEPDDFFNWRDFLKELKELQEQNA